MVCLLLGLSVYLYLPIRSAQDTPIQWNTIDSLSAFWEHVSRSEYKEAEGGIWYSGNPKDALQFLLASVMRLPSEQGGLLVLFSLIGLPIAWRNHRDVFYPMAGIILLNVPVLMSMGTATFTPTSEYITRLYYLPATAATAVLTTIGWGHATGWALDRLRSSARGSASIALILAAPLFPLALNWVHCDRTDYRIAEEYSENLLRCMPEGGAVFPLTNNESFLLAYQRFVEGDDRACLLDSRFGWKHDDKAAAVLTQWDVGEGAAHPLRSHFKDISLFRDSLYYRVRGEEKGEGLGPFRFVREIPLQIRYRPEDFPRMSPF